MPEGHRFHKIPVSAPHGHSYFLYLADVIHFPYFDMLSRFVRRKLVDNYLCDIGGLHGGRIVLMFVLSEERCLDTVRVHADDPYSRILELFTHGLREALRGEFACAVRGTECLAFERTHRKNVDDETAVAHVPYRFEHTECGAEIIDVYELLRFAHIELRDRRIRYPNARVVEPYIDLAEFLHCCATERFHFFS